LHFENALDPGFREMTTAVIAAHSSPAELKSALAVIRAQHHRFIDDAVVPAFDVDVRDGSFSGFAARIAKWAVPVAANCFREDAIHDDLIDYFGGSTGSAYYQQLSPHSATYLYGSRKCKLLLAAAGD
jgi:hypothetical protein